MASFSDRPLRVAVICSSDPLSGGAAPYERSAVRRLSALQSSDVEFIVFTPRGLGGRQVVAESRLQTATYRLNHFELLMTAVRSSFVASRFLMQVRLGAGGLERRMRRHDVDVAYFLAPNPLALSVIRTGLITTVWDLGHRDIPEYPEVAHDKRFEYRDHYYRSVLPRSIHTIVDTDATRQRLHNLYQVDLERISAVGLLSDPAADFGSDDTVGDVSEYGRFIFYPAQFWPHKRHALLIRAFATSDACAAGWNLVLTGSDKGNLAFLQALTDSLGMGERVHFPGFVDDVVLNTLYRNAHVVAFPSALGPSNLPPLEAIAVGTPVLVSGVHRDPALRHSLVRVVGDESPAAWAAALDTACSASKPRVSYDVASDTRYEQALLDVLRRYRVARSNWQ